MPFLPRSLSSLNHLESLDSLFPVLTSSFPLTPSFGGPMASVTITEQNFESTINNNDLVVFDFWASWCGPCRQFAPTFEKASEKHTDYVFGKVNTEEERGLSQAFGIRSIPTLIIFREGIGVYQEMGAMPPRALEEILQKVRELDMDEVRKAVEAQEAAGDEVPWELRED